MKDWDDFNRRSANFMVGKDWQLELKVGWDHDREKLSEDLIDAILKEINKDD